MTQARRPRVYAALLALLISCVVFAGDAPAMMPPAQDDPGEIIEIGSGPLSERSMTFVGRNQYGAGSILLFGYLSSIVGLDASGPYASETASSQSARFTYTAEVAIAATRNRADVTSTEGAGSLRIYFDEAAGASWDDPESFSDGQLVAEYALILRDTLQRQAPGVGVLVGDGRLTQATAGEFAIGSDQMRFGRVGIEQRFQYVGAQIAGSGGGAPPIATVTGLITITGRESLAAQIVDPRAPRVPATPPAAEGCAQLQPWLEQTDQSLERALALGVIVDDEATLDALDPAPLAQAAADVAALAAGQRAIEVPENGIAANRLAVTAISTYARGLDSVATAAAAQDAELFTQGKSALRDGAGLIGRARDAAAALAAQCDGDVQGEAASS